jgi:broad specificity phosphatase PhoE
MSVSGETIIHFIRHGENPANLTREFSCRRVDYPLTERGIQQARQTAEHLRSRSLAAVYASPLKRASQTATILAEALELPVMIREEFREINVGRLEDEPPTEENWALHDRIFETWLHGDPAVRFPDGECQLDLLRRMRMGLEEIVTTYPGREVALVGHGGILAATIGHLCFGNLPNEGDHIPNCSITELAFSCVGGRLQGELRAWAVCGHLA